MIEGRWIEEEEASALVVRFKAGEEDAKWKLFTGIIPFANYILTRRVNIKDQEEVDSLSPNAILKAFSNIKKYDPSFKFYTWLGTVIHNYAVDSFRKKGISIGKKWQEQEDEIPTKRREDEVEEDFFTTDLEETLLSSFFLDAIDHLKSYECRVSFILRYCAGLSNEELRLLLGNIPLNTVKSYNRKAIIALHEEMKNKFKGIPLNTLLHDRGNPTFHQENFEAISGRIMVSETKKIFITVAEVRGLEPAAEELKITHSEVVKHMKKAIGDICKDTPGSPKGGKSKKKLSESEAEKYFEEGYAATSEGEAPKDRKIRSGTAPGSLEAAELKALGAYVHKMFHAKDPAYYEVVLKKLKAKNKTLESFAQETGLDYKTLGDAFHKKDAVKYRKKINENLGLSVKECSAPVYEMDLKNKKRAVRGESEVLGMSLKAMKEAWNKIKDI